MDVEISLLLPGEAGIRQVFRSRAAANRNVAVVTVLGFQSAVRIGDAVDEFLRQLRCEDGRADTRAGGLQHLDRFHIEMAKIRFDDRREASAAQEGSIGIRGGREPIRRPNAKRGQRSAHLAERGVLATHGGQIGHADFIEPANPIGHHFPFSLLLAVTFTSGASGDVSSRFKRHGNDRPLKTYTGE